MASSCCARFSPISVTPASASDADVLDGEVLDRGEQLDVARLTAGAARGGGDLLAHPGDVLARPARV